MIVYLEDVLPSGRVVYLTEGVLRLADRQPASAALGADRLHSYLSQDASPMPAAGAVRVRIALSPIAAVLRKGERLRISIAGADADNLERIPSSGPVSLTIERSPNAPSFVELPVLAKP